MKTFHIIGRPKPVEPVEPSAPLRVFERNDIVKHVKTGVHYRLMRVQRDRKNDGKLILRARRIIMMDTDPSGYRNWRFDPKAKPVRLAETSIAHVQKP